MLPSLLISRRQSLLLLVSVIFSLGLLVALPVYAAHTVRPLVADFALEPRGIANQTITIENNSTQQARVYATVNAVALDGTGAITEFVPRGQANDVATVTSWLEISRGRIVIPPGERHEIPLRVQVHPNAEPGIYHAFIGFPRARNRDEAQALVMAGQAPGMTVRIEVDDGRQAFLRLEQFATERIVIDPKQSVFTYTIANPGDIPLAPQGELIVYDGRGREIGAIPVNPEHELIAPGNTVTFTSALPAGGGLGRHRALLSLTYGEGQRASITDTIFFHQLPLPQLIMIFLVCLAVATLVAYWVHRRYSPVELEEEYAAVRLTRRDQVRSVDAEHDVDLRTCPIDEEEVTESTPHHERTI